MLSPHQWALGLILGVYVALSITYNALLPIWEAPEEPAHVEYVRYIQTTHALAVRPSGTPASPTPPSVPGTEFSQTPLVYVLLAAALSPIHLPPDASWHRNPYVTWPGHPFRNAVALHRTDEGWPYHGLALFVHAGRLLATLCGLVTLAATYALVTRVTDRPADGLFAAAWLGWTPGFILATSRLNNDATGYAFSALTLIFGLVLLRRAPAPPSGDSGSYPGLPGHLVGASVGLTLALLSKLDTIFLVPLVGVATALAPGRHAPVARCWARRAFAVLGVFALPVVAVGAWWVAYGHTFSGGLGQQVGVAVIFPWTLIGEVTGERLLDAAWWLNTSWWDRPGFSADVGLPAAVYAVVTVPAVGLFAAGVVALARRAWWSAFGDRARLAAIALALSILPIAYATIARQVAPSIGLDANARFLLPAGPAVAFVIALGARFFPIGRFGRPFAVAYLLGLLALAVTTPLVVFPQLNVPTIPARLARDQAEATRPALASFANGVELLDPDHLPDVLTPGQPLPVVLHWRVATAPAGDFVVSAHLVDRSGNRVSGLDVVPFESSFPPRLWEPGELIDQPLAVPVPGDLGPGVYALRIGLYRRDQGAAAPIPLACGCGSTDALVTGRWKVLPDLAGSPPEHPADVLFGDAIALRGYTTRSEATGLRVSLFWQSLQRVSRDLVVSVQVLDGQGQLVAQHDGEPADGRLPTTTWDPGEVIRDDHVVALSRPLTGLTTTLLIYDRDTGRRLTVAAPGLPAQDRFALDR